MAENTTEFFVRNYGSSMNIDEKTNETLERGF
jgi:hypothetical protein